MIRNENDEWEMEKVEKEIDEDENKENVEMNSWTSGVLETPKKKKNRV